MWNCAAHSLAAAWFEITNQTRKKIWNLELQVRVAPKFSHGQKVRTRGSPNSTIWHSGARSVEKILTSFLVVVLAGLQLPSTADADRRGEERKKVVL